MFEILIKSSLLDLPQYICIFFLVLMLMILISYKGNLISMKKFIPNYIAPQKIHQGDISRLGGIIMVLGVAFLFSMSSNIEIKENMVWFLLAFLPLGVLTIAEDLHQTIPPLLRLVVMFVSSWLILKLTNIPLPILDTPFLKDILSDPSTRNIFYTLCLVGLMNGTNFVDGTNGNFAFMTISMLISLCFLACIVSDKEFISLIIISIIPLLAFTLINYPWGRIFAGDLGAYFYGALIGFFVIMFFGRHNDISAWNALLITFYPIAELTFSAIRKLWRHKSPLQADRKHLHIKIYSILYRGSGKSRQANSMVTLFLGLFWLTPTMLLPWVYQSHFLLAISLILLIFFYIILNITITKVD